MAPLNERSYENHKLNPKVPGPFLKMVAQQGPPPYLAKSSNTRTEATEGTSRPAPGTRFAHLDSPSSMR